MSDLGEDMNDRDISAVMSIRSKRSTTRLPETPGDVCIFPDGCLACRKPFEDCPMRNEKAPRLPPAFTGRVRR